MGGWLKRLFGGCHASHEMKEGGKMAKDLVCGMEVDEKRTVAKSEHMGRTYYFCALGCKKAFNDNPQKYLKEKPEQARGCC